MQSEYKGESESLSAIEARARYRRLRYRLGLPEGVAEYKGDEGLPLEANGDLCGAISFSKGCYLGQELTARSRFTGVIRRRITPIQFEATATGIDE